MELDKPRRVVVYCRVATASPLGDDSSMVNQSAALRCRAERDGLEIVGEVRAYEKGVTLDRSGWRDALRLAAEKQADGIMVKDLDRIARGTPLLMQALREMEQFGLKPYSCGDLNCFFVLKTCSCGF